MLAEEPDRDRPGLGGLGWGVQGHVGVGERVLGAGPGAGLHRDAGGPQGGHELLEHLRRVELVALGEVELDGAVDATRLLLVQGGVVDGDRVEGPVVAWSRTRNPPMEKPRPPTGPPTVRSRRAAMAASSLARALALSMASMSASACSGSLAVRPS
jgi:hypothetical protein